MNTIDIKRFYTIKEIMEQLGLSRLTIYRYIKSWKLEAYKFWLEYRIKKEDLDKFIELSKK